MAKKLMLIKFRKDDFERSALYHSFKKFVFDPRRFGIGSNIFLGEIEDKFGSAYKVINEFRDFSPKIESIYYDLEKAKIRKLIVSVIDYYDHEQFLLIHYIPTDYKYEIVYINKNINALDTAEDDQNCINEEISKQITDIVKIESFEMLGGLRNDYYLRNQGIYYVDASLINEKLADILRFKLVNKLETTSFEEIELLTIGVDIQNPKYKPHIWLVEFSYEDIQYEFDVYNNELKMIDETNDGDTSFSILKAYFEIAQTDYINRNSHIVEEYEAEKRKEETEEILKKLYNSFTLKQTTENEYGFAELGDKPFITFSDTSVLIKTSKNDDEAEEISFSYDNINNDKESIKNIVDGYISSRSKNVNLICKYTDDFIDNEYDLETYIKKGEEINKMISSLSQYDKVNEPIKSIEKRVKEKQALISSVDKTKISRCLELINKIKNITTYEEYSDDFFDAYDELDEFEKTLIKKEYNDFLKTFGDVAVDFDSFQTLYRGVFIRRSVFDELLALNRKETKLNILKVTSEIVKALKTYPGSELGRYLVSKGINRPIPNDRTIKKIRIMNHEKFRLLYVDGSDLDDEDRLANYDGIYIFGLTKHDKDKKELYSLAKKKPTKYTLNEYMLYPHTKPSINIPECTAEQYNIASFHDNKAVVTFGCAGSGKTTVSIEQYKNIVYSDYGCISPGPEELVYITFHERLSILARDALLEYSINANSFKLDAYFAYVVGEPYEPSKVINETKFIEWFNQEYSDEEINKNRDKKRSKIAPLNNKPDKPRLIYTYYRGVFRGSKKLFETKNNYLSLEEFMTEMKKEAYLSDEEKGAIYTICTEFYQYTVDNGLLGDNDFALRVIRQASNDIKRTKCIIIDEVQDLTEIELIATILTLREDSEHIYFYGDPHQSINPNIFESGTINGVYNKLREKSSIKTSQLTISYRTNKHLILYLNKLLEYRNKWIGLTPGGQEKIIQPDDISKDTSWAGYVTNKDLYERLFICNPDSMIITPSEASRQAMLDKYKSIKEDRIITIYDAKGREWDTVIMCNMFTEYEPYFMDMITGDGKSDSKAKRSTIHRMTFNKFYVGCTRSRKSFVLIEEDDKFFDKDNPIYQTLLSSFAEISEANQIDTYMLENNTFEGWYKEAVQCLYNESDLAFRHNYTRALALADTPEKIKMLRDLLEGDADTLANYGFAFLANKAYRSAGGVFFRAYKKDEKYGPYIALSAVLEGRKQKDKHIRGLLKNPSIMEKYPEVYSALLNQEYIKQELKKAYDQLFNKEDK